MRNDSIDHPQGEILIADDTPSHLRLLVVIFTTKGYAVRPMPNGKLALSSARAQPPDLILLDIKMPEISGYDVCEQLKADPRTREIATTFTIQVPLQVVQYAGVVKLISNLSQNTITIIRKGTKYIRRPMNKKPVRCRLIKPLLT